MSMLVNPYRFASGSADPYFSSVVLLCPFDGNSTDYSPTTPHTLTNRNGLCVINSTNPPPFQSQSTGMSEISGECWTIPNSADFHFGSGDFTIEGYFRQQTTNDDCLMSCNNFSGSFGWAMNNDGDGNLQFIWSVNGTSLSSVAYAHGSLINSWEHYAFSRVGNTGYLCMSGVIRATTSMAGVTIHNSTATAAIGGLTDGTSNQFNGRVAGVRITKGVGRYSGAVNDALTLSPPWPTS